MVCRNLLPPSIQKSRPLFFLVLFNFPVSFLLSLPRNDTSSSIKGLSLFDHFPNKKMPDVRISVEISLKVPSSPSVGATFPLGKSTRFPLLSVTSENSIFDLPSPNVPGHCRFEFSFSGILKTPLLLFSRIYQSREIGSSPGFFSPAGTILFSCRDAVDLNFLSMRLTLV